MREYIVKCDKCGKTTGASGFKVVFGYESAVEAGRLDSPETDKLDFCEECMKDIQSMVARFVQKPKQTKPGVDRGKVTALYRAGWKPKTIADEMGCTVQTIYNVIKEIEENAGHNEQ